MLFNSFQFLVFFIVVTSLYFTFPHRYRWFLLLAASCYFYMAFVPVYILILLFTIIVDYGAGILIEGSTGKRRRLLLTLSIVANVGVLAFFKYYNFFSENISSVTTVFGHPVSLLRLNILLPIGLSFHTFQSMSYTLEVYRSRQKAERHFGLFALYVMFYPQLVAGPIERPQNLLPQFRVEHDFNYDRATSGLRLIAWGLLKKVVIADRLAIVVDSVYNQPQTANGPTLILATFFFSFQIYCDFSGYSDIAIGTARVMGFTLMQNFATPYQSKSVAEFWTRWHISLSTWFRDYLYIPLGGSRVRVPRWYLNILIVFLVSGLWHGARWTFVVWGALHGLYLIVGSATLAFRNRIGRILFLNGAVVQICTTFLLLSFAWIFFRSETLPSSFHIISKMVGDVPRFVVSGIPLASWLTFPDVPSFQVTVDIVLIAFLTLTEYYQNRVDLNQWFDQQSIAVRWSAYYVLIIFLIVMGVFGNREFIYFQF